jgi:hypothetical protein
MITMDRIVSELTAIALADPAAITSRLHAGGIAALGTLGPAAAAIRSLTVEIEHDGTRRVVAVGFENQRAAARLLRELLTRQRQ